MRETFSINVWEMILKTRENITGIDTRQEDHCATGCLLSYVYFKESYNSIAINPNKQ